ncbi:VWA domain-containing protein [Acidiplasma sp.]|uniref:VWA domain-containing protein n=1 Tax=Acidiplasma sp. TaxID=1872114 RepID=UPI00258ED48B|nr:VWA domain-containing protein [Acidiplasma sp.]
MKINYFPFSAILGNDDIKLGLIINAIDPKIGGILITGPKGIAKSTMVRSLSNILPEMDSIRGCRFNCTLNSENLCDECREKIDNNSAEIVKKSVPVITLPISSTLDRVVGSIDINSAISGRVNFREGLLGEANNGILYIDEVNLLDDSIADAILDSAASGINTVERDGVSYIHPARFILVGTMNPEEGELRPQLLDRFGISAEGKLPSSAEELIEIANRVDEFDHNPVEFISKYDQDDEILRERIVRARNALRYVIIPDDIEKYMADVILKYHMGNRAMISAVKAARAIAAYNGNKNVTMEDARKALEFALRHRISEEEKSNMERELNNTGQNQGNKNENINEDMNNNDINNDEKMPVKKNNSTGDDTLNNIENPRIDMKLRNEIIKKSGRNAKSGNFIRTGHKNGNHLDLYSSMVSMKINNHKKMQASDIVLREGYSGGAVPVIIAIDSSTSMGFKRRIGNALELSKLLFKKAYITRSRVALISFSGTGARVLMNFSRNFTVLNQRLKSIKSSGKTPLLEGLKQIYKTSAYSGEKTVSVLFTDGRGNYPPGNMKDDIIDISKKLKNVSRLYIINGENGFLPTYNNLIAEYSNGHIISDVNNVKIN